MAFVIQNSVSGAQAVSGAARGMGLGNDPEAYPAGTAYNSGTPIGHSAAIAYDFFPYYSNANPGLFSVAPSVLGAGTGFNVNGGTGSSAENATGSPLTPLPVFGGSSNTYVGSNYNVPGDPINMTVSYNAATQVLTWSGTDSLVGSAFNGLTFSETQTGVNLASITGSNMAYFGFAGADGEFGSTQIISNFNVSTLAGANNVLPSTTPLFIAAGGTLNLFGGTQQVASLSGSGVVTNSLSSSISTLTVGGSNTSQTFAGTLQDGAGTLALAMVGPGTLTLTGTNEYSGGTYVYSGTLIAANNEAIEDGTNLYVGSDVGAFFGTAVPAGASAASAANSQGATAAVPEPGTLALVVVALSGAAVYRRRRSKTAVAKGV